MNWKQAAIIAGGTAAAGVLLYYLLRSEEKTNEDNYDNADRQNIIREKIKKKRFNINDVTKEEVLLVLKDILRSQEKMKFFMKDITNEIAKNNFSFEETYKLVKEIQPEDPLEEYGISVNDFDNFLDKYQFDPSIKEAIGKIMGGPNMQQTDISKLKNISKDTVIEVHEYMLNTLRELIGNLKKHPNRDKYDIKIATIAIQAIVGAKVEDKFKLSCDDVENAVLSLQHLLLADDRFTQINIRMQGAMSELMGIQFPAFQ